MFNFSLDSAVNNIRVVFQLTSHDDNDNDGQLSGQANENVDRWGRYHNDVFVNENENENDSISLTLTIGFPESNTEVQNGNNQKNKR